MKIIFASHNKNKIEEINNVLKASNIKIISLFDLEEFDEVAETGNNFAENAKIKAEYYYNKYQIPVLADDTGLIIPAFDHKPGVYSARYAGENASYLDNNLKLLEDITMLKDRKAYFETSICYINKEAHYFTGRLHGKIATDITNYTSFGYDPIFILDDGRRLSELSIEEKNIISHRGKALQKWLEFMKDWGER